MTHGELYRCAVRLASALAASGVHRQDRVAVLGRNTIEFGILLAATQLSGVILVPINVPLSEAEVRAALRRVASSILFHDDEFALLVGQLAEQLPNPLRTVTFNGSTRRPVSVTLEEFSAGGADSLPHLADPDDIACLLFTSGTTGAAKCAVIGQRELWRIAQTMNAELRTGCEDLALINMPLFHVGALAMVLGLHARGGAVILQQQFDAAEAVRLARAEPITVLHLAPVLLQWLIDGLGPGGTLGEVRTVVYAAAPMSTATLLRATSALPRAGFLNLYGQTEVIVSSLRADGLPGLSDRMASGLGRLAI